MEEHRRLQAEIKASMRECASRTGRATLSLCVEEAMARVPREAFVPDSVRAYAQLNQPLPIGFGQTISQPFIVALMTELLDPEPEHVVLEVGAGSGYAAAVLAEIVRRVYTVERVADLAHEAGRRLARLGYDNVSVHLADGYEGWPDAAPFDGIAVTAAAPAIPGALVEQLKPGGRMVIPVGIHQFAQDLVLVVKDEGGAVTEQDVLPVAFVPLVPREEPDGGEL